MPSKPIKASKPKSAKPDLAEATVSEFDGVRYLHLGTEWVQGAMRIRKPQKLELEYIQRMMAWLLWLPSEQLERGHAVQLGLGAGAITRFCHQVMRWRTTAVELNPHVLMAGRLWFQLPPDDERLSVVEGDAALWVQQTENLATVQALCVDLYDHDAAGPVLDDEAFYLACRSVLDDGGVMSVNLFGRSANFERSAARIIAAFGDDPVWQLSPTKEGNTVVLAGRALALPDRDELERRASVIEQRFALPARKWLRMMKPCKR